MKLSIGLATTALTALIAAKPALATIPAPQTTIADVATVKLNSTFQTWSMANSHHASTEQNWRLRRAQFKLSGQIGEPSRYFLMVDLARLITLPGAKPAPRSSVLQDVAAAYSFAPGWEVTAGQFKTPTTAEGLDSSADLALPERSLIGRTFGNRREIGAKLGYKAALWNASAMLATAQTLSSDTFGTLDDLHGRVEYTPTKIASVGAFATLSDFEYEARGRWGVNARARVAKSDLRAEYAQGRDGAVQTRGATAEAGYWITENFEPVARIETFETSSSPNYTGTAETIGVNYLFRDFNTKLQVAGTAMQHMAAPQGSPVLSKDAANQMVTVALQATL